MDDDAAEWVDDGCGEAVAVGVDADDAVDLASQHAHGFLLTDRWPWLVGLEQQHRGTSVMGHTRRWTGC
jgi:hypothetical protein